MMMKTWRARVAWPTPRVIFFSCDFSFFCVTLFGRRFARDRPTERTKTNEFIFHRHLSTKWRAAALLRPRSNGMTVCEKRTGSCFRRHISGLPRTFDCRCRTNFKRLWTVYIYNIYKDGNEYEIIIKICIQIIKTCTQNYQILIT